MSHDLGQSGELLMARLRLGLILILALNPIKSVLLDVFDVNNWIGLGVMSMVVILGTWLLWLAGKPQPPRVLPWVTSELDVLFISLASVGFLVAGDPIVATNSFYHWSYYMLAVGATCLRHNPRLTIVTTVSAVVQLLGIALASSALHPGIRSEYYGYFDWDSQVGRMIAITVMGLLSLAVVARNRQVWESSVRDKLTGLHNRRFFDEFLDYKCAEYGRQGRPFSLVMIDIDFFKQVNDKHGHQVGDRVLQELSGKLSREFRSSDITARWGGEEFAIILSDSDLETALTRMNLFHQDLARESRAVPFTVSMGIAAFPRDAGSAEALLTAADANLYAAKRGGRNRIVSSGLS